MRHHRRASFAAPFVMIVSAACGAPHKHEPIHDNPPGPTPVEPDKPKDLPPVALDAEHCQALVADADCAPEGESCRIREGCGLEGYTCEAGHWKKQMRYCNPPAPKN